MSYIHSSTMVPLTIRHGSYRATLYSFSSQISQQGCIHIPINSVDMSLRLYNIFLVNQYSSHSRGKKHWKIGKRGAKAIWDQYPCNLVKILLLLLYIARCLCRVLPCFMQKTMQPLQYSYNRKSEMLHIPLLGVGLVLLLFLASPGSSCKEEEKTSLLEFLNGLSQASGLNSSWQNDTNCCL